MVRGFRLLQVPIWCDPYANFKKACGDMCTDGVGFLAKEGSVRTVGIFNAKDAEADGMLQEKIRWAELQIQKEMVEHGPVSVAFMAFDDFISYTEGIYEVTSRGASSQHAAGHSVVLLGWGVDTVNGEDIPYWLIQNQWGKGWGMDGLAKFRRGKNEAALESWGLDAVKMLSPNICPDTHCKHGSEKQQDCSCRCRGAWQGLVCDQCHAACGVGRQKDGECACACPPGVYGEYCQNAIGMSSFSSCEGERGQSVTITWNARAEPPMKGSVVAFFKHATQHAFSLEGVWNDVSSGHLCGMVIFLCACVYVRVSVRVLLCFSALMHASF